MVKMTVFMAVTASIDPKVISDIPGNREKFLDKLEVDTGATISVHSEDKIHFVKGSWEAVDHLRHLLELCLCQQTAQRTAAEELHVTQVHVSEIEKHYSSEIEIYESKTVPPNPKKFDIKKDESETPPICRTDLPNSGPDIPFGDDRGGSIGSVSEGLTPESNMSNGDEILVKSLQPFSCANMQSSSDHCGAERIEDTNHKKASVEVNVGVIENWPNFEQPKECVESDFHHHEDGISSSSIDKLSKGNVSAGDNVADTCSTIQSNLTTLNEKRTDHPDAITDKPLAYLKPFQIPANKTDVASGMSGESIGNSQKLSSIESSVMDKDEVAESNKPFENGVIRDPWPLNFRPKKLQPMKLAISSLKNRLKNNPTPSSSVLTRPTEPIPPLKSVDMPQSKSSVDHSDMVSKKVSDFFMCKDKLSQSQEILDLAQRVRNASMKRSARRGKIPLRPRLLLSKTFEVLNGDVGSSYSRSTLSPAVSVTSKIEEYRNLKAQGCSDSELSPSALSNTSSNNTSSSSQNRQYSDCVGLSQSFSVPDVPLNYLRPKQRVCTISSTAASSFAKSYDVASESMGCIKDWPASSTFGLNLRGENTRSTGHFSKKSSIPMRSLSFPVQDSEPSANTREIMDLSGGTTAVVFSNNGAVREPMKMQPERNLSNVTPASLGPKPLGHVETTLAAPRANPLPVHSDLNLNANSLYQGLDAFESEFGKPFKCDMCRYETNDCKNMRSRRRRCQVEGQYICKVCAKCFNLEKDLFEHVKNHETSRNISCHSSICSDVFTSSTSLNEHVKVHDTEKRGVTNAVTCSECDITFSSAHKLQIHLKMFHQEQHSGFVCQECGKSFSQKHSLVEPQNLHLGVRPFQCEVCNKDFSFKTSLRQHMMLHNTGKNYSCQSCGKGFMQKNSLKIHTAIHENKRSHVCSYCGKGFTQKQAMQRHERIHSGERPYTCKICDKRFNDSSILRRHMNVHQSEEGQDGSSKRQ